ncbi:MAG: nuclear transport factor 2 family protein, partial [Acidimicrobiia bacterium]|nr:nuclear transport factor 2 family protein [Acidimicrobiia bacterium]
MDQSSLPMTLQDLAAQQEIRDVLIRYTRGIDRMDADLVRSTYHPDAHDDHGAYQGGVDGFIEWV